MNALPAFLRAFEQLVASGADESAIFRAGRPLLAALIADDDWLPAALAQPDPDSYRIHLLHLDPARRFSVSAMVWGPGQGTPIHDHTVWGMVGMLRGRERCEEFGMPLEPGKPLVAGAVHDLLPGDIDLVSPTIGDIHRVSNARADGASVSIHVYGGDLAGLVRSRYDEAGRATPFVSPYASCLLPERAC
ncbi:cysteine dioxygenase [Massilia sp. WF1]|uniref:cysteine dioxygenase family protein n=1 Tax=unclassified Massilia TaxID=2609279 RepID=UPI0006496C2A|nr:MULTISPECIES: cysteine dioxygenase [unclassified Massilia]ALK98079.1 cysteine dioxygenase [Massilia sp. WG5]KLU35552.1 cysteine dioxygenase [Massilia sp. WF1]